MSDLSRASGAREWLKAWKEHAEEGHGAYALRNLERALREQTQNCDSVARRLGESSSTVVEYRRSIRLLQGALKRFRRIANRQAAEQEREASAREAEAQAAYAEAVRKHPHIRRYGW